MIRVGDEIADIEACRMNFRELLHMQNEAKCIVGIRDAEYAEQRLPKDLVSLEYFGDRRWFWSKRELREVREELNRGKVSA